MTIVDYCVIAVYLVFMLAIGPVYKRFSTTASDYFRGGGGMLWWMVGASAWVMTFTAWTFTGGAGKVYDTGTFFLLLIVGNVVATVVMYLFTAARYRQMRVITPIEAARDRFGRVSEQWFTWLPVPINILRGGIGLYAIAIFMSIVFGVSMEVIIVGLGVAVTAMCIFGGSFAVVASDFVQMLTILVITLVISFLALRHPAVGGLGNMVEHLPAAHFDWTVFERPGVIAVFTLTIIINQTVQMNSLMEGASRFIYVKSGKDAKRALLVSFFGMLLFTPIFILPAMAATLVFPDLASRFPQLNNPSEGSYVAMAMELLPSGMLGLLVCGIFAATMTSMDSGLNRAAGIFVRNFYIVFVKPDASETHQVRAGQITTAVFGTLQIFAGLAFISYQDLPLFELVLLIAAVFGLPMAVPLFIGIFIKRTPPWSGWSTMLVGIGVGLLMQPFSIGGYEHEGLITAGLIESWFEVDTPFNATELSDLRLSLTTGVVFLVCLTWFFGSLLFRKFNRPTFDRQVDEFFERMDTPIDLVAEGVAGWKEDRRHYHVLGVLCMLYGGFILVLAVLPNPLWGRLCFVFCGAVIGGLGLLLYLIGRRPARPATDGVVPHPAATRARA